MEFKYNSAIQYNTAQVIVFNFVTIQQNFSVTFHCLENVPLFPVAITIALT